MLHLVKGDICSFAADGIVNAGNERLLGCFTPIHKCLDNQIHKHAGRQLTQACQAIMRGRIAKPSQCIITPAFNLKKFGIHSIIHAYGPNCTVPPLATNPDEANYLLKQTYLNCLDLAQDNNLASLAFPAISTGLYGFDPDRAAQIAIQTTREWLEKNKSSNIKITFVMFPDNYKRYKRYLLIV